MSTTVNYASIPLGKAVRLTTGDTSRTAPSTTGTLIPVATYAAGAWVERATVTMLATVTQTVVRLFKYDVANTAYHLYDEIDVPAKTLTGTVAALPITHQAVTNPTLYPFQVPVGWELRCTVNDTQTGLEISVDGGGY